MRAVHTLILCSLGAGLAGCTLLEPLPGPVPASPAASAYSTGTPGSSASAIRPASGQAPSQQLSRAMSVLDRIQTSNAQLPFKAELAIKAVDRPYIGHGGMSRIWISEDLIDRCQSDEQLAAILALELAKITCEAQQRAVELARARESELPLEVRIGPDSGPAGEADQLQKVEIAKRGLDRRRRADDQPPPDRNLLARQYLSKAGYPETALDGVQSLFATKVSPDAKRLPPIVVPAVDSRSSGPPTPRN
jgi:hypothetical protein